MPQLGETVSEGTLAVWHVSIGDSVKKNDPLLDVETDKAALEVPAPEDGTVAAISVEAGETVEVGTVLAVIDVAGENSDEPDLPAKAAAPAADEPQAASTNSIAGRNLNASTVKSDHILSPAVRRLVTEHDIDISLVTPTGKKGRVTRYDVIQYIERFGTPAAAPSSATALPIPQVSAAASSDTLIPFDRIRKITAEHMVMSKAVSPHVLQAVEVQYTGVDLVRKRLAEFWKKEKCYSLTYLPFIAKALTMAIAEFPRINASIEGDALRLHSKINLAIAVDLNFEGLVAPVLKDCAQLSVSKIAANIRQLSEKAHSMKLSPDDFTDGTYTISNSGPFGTLLTAPIINQPQVAIISTDGIRKRPVVLEDKHGDTIAIRPVGILAQSFDHRALDGAYSAAFLNRVRDIIENHDWSSEF